MWPSAIVRRIWSSTCGRNAVTKFGCSRRLDCSHCSLSLSTTTRVNFEPACPGVDWLVTTALCLPDIIHDIVLQIERDPQAKRPRVCERLGTELLLQVNSDIPYRAVTKIENSLRDEQQSLVQVQGKIAAADPKSDELHALQIDEVTIEDSIKVHKQLLRPGVVRSLPAEVLSMIFSWYLHLCHLQAKAILDAVYRSGRATSKTMDAYVIAHNTAPLIPMSVCQRWRQTVINDSSLWTMVALSGRGRPAWRPDRLRKETMLSVTFPPPSAYQKQLEILQLQMARANLRPLSITLHLSSSHLIQRHLIPILLNTALDAFSRATEFHLDFNYINAPLRDYLQGDNLKHAEGLHTLTIVFATEFGCNRSATLEMQIPKLTRIFLAHTPNLQRLVLDIPADAIERSLPRAAVISVLVELEIRKPIDLYLFLILMEKAPALEVLKVFRVLASSRREDEDGYGMHYFNSLESLHVTWAELQESDGMFDCITLPALRRLDISTYPTDSWPTESHVAFFERSGCKLQTLTVRESPINERVAELLVGQHDLHELHLEHNPGDNWMPGFESDFEGIQSGVTMKALRFLTETQELKALRHLTISVAPKQLMKVKELLTARFVRAEECGFAKLESCRVYFNRGGASSRSRKAETSFYDDGKPEKPSDDASHHTSKHQLSRTATILTSPNEVNSSSSRPESNGYQRLLQPFVDQGLRLIVEVRDRYDYEQEFSMPDDE